MRVLVVDDEPLARRRLEILLRDVADVELAGTAADGLAARRMIADLAPDVVLLDIKMPGLNGLEVLDALTVTEAPPVVIFVTAFDRFAVEAFDRAASDYLLKPVEPERLAAALRRAREVLSRRQAAERVEELEELVRNLRGGPAPAETTFRELWVQERGGRAHLAVAAIDWIAAERDYVRIHAGQRSYLVRLSIVALAARLDPAQFIRVHRSSLVRADRIVRVRNAAGRGSVTLSTGVEVAVSRRHMAALKALTTS
jgi:DNA-binding LytR/AlgR family response regulator